MRIPSGIGAFPRLPPYAAIAIAAAILLGGVLLALYNERSYRAQKIDEVTDDELSGSLRTTLLNYEPRLDRKTIRVRRDASIGPEQLKLRFIVHADLKAEPLNVPVEFVADVELDSGDIQINRL